MSGNQEYRDEQGTDRDKSVREDTRENVQSSHDEKDEQKRGKDAKLISNPELGHFGKESIGVSENNQGNRLGNYDKIDASAQGSVMQEADSPLSDSEKPETKVPPSFIETDSKTGTPQNETNPSKSYHGNPVIIKPERREAVVNNTEEGVHAENIGGTSEEG